MKRTLFILLALLCLQHSFAAEDDTAAAAPVPVRYNAVKLGGTVASIFIPMAQVGYEQRRGRRSWQGAIALGFPQRYNIDDTIRGTALAYSLRLSGRFYPVHQLKLVNIYLGAELFYTWFKRPHSGNFYYPLDKRLNVRHYYDEYLMKKHTFGAVLQAGLTTQLTDRLFLDFSAGLGLKLMYTSQQGRIEEGTVIQSKNLNVHAVESELYYVTSVATPLQLSIGYILR